MSGPIDVCIVPEYPMGLMQGGLQVQARETVTALNQQGTGVSANLFDWSHGNPDAQLYHFIGFPPYLSRVADLVAAKNRPYIITLLMGGLRPSLRLRVAASRRALRLNTVTRDHTKAIQKATIVIAITDTEAAAIQSVYNVQRKSIRVIPHGVSELFTQTSPNLWHEHFGKRPFVLCVGAIQPRKNQLLLLNSCNDLGIAAVLLGPPLPGCEKYCAAVSDAVAANSKFGGRWITTLTNENPLLASCYAAARVFVLLSQAETQPISVMQAMATNTPVLILDAAYAEDPLFAKIPRVQSDDPRSVKSAIQQSWKNPIATKLPNGYLWPHITSQLHNAYAEALQAGTAATGSSAAECT